jgi:hypothetical protein
LLLAFRRELNGAKGAVEQLMDTIAGELAFHRSFFGPLVSAARGRPLDFGLIGALRDSFAPTASLLSVTNAVAAMWPRPALSFIATVGGKRADPTGEQALRVRRQCTNLLARSQHFSLVDNMRVPLSSIAYAAFQSGSMMTGRDRCIDWRTSGGYHLPDVGALVSALPMGKWLYGVMSL